MSVTIKEKSKKNKQIGMQPGLPIPKKSADKDQLAITACMIENLSKDQAFERVKLASDMHGYSAFYLGGVLSVICSNNWYSDYKYTNFVEFVKDKFGISKSKAYDCMGIYQNLIESDVAWKDIEHLGWTKIRLIAVHLTEESLEKWIEIALSHNVVELRKFVNQSMSKIQEALFSEVPKLSTHVENNNQITGLVSTELVKPVPKKVFYHLFPDQIEIIDAAIKLAMDESETSFKNVALENICMDYLSRY